ncbi:N-acetylmuramoyl-L-alanine amidase-like domain-containing protein [Shivajiella indica]|uniref:N-acetylmuramoyl-L-alanine amidase-like domain-containing protein n=1 Tax=Shivajiella indica TaxID=872115 RepID=A0ABW5B5B4_9BACT
MRLFTITLLFVSMLAQGQTVCSLESRQRLEGILDDLSRMDNSSKSLNELNVEIGSWFLNTDYVEKTLEISGDENLVINLTGLDCTTYLETVVTLSRLAKQGMLTFEDFERELEYIRYQNGKRLEYPSRLHYFSDWIYQNQQKGILKDISQEIGGKYYENTPSFMSSNPQFYAQLSNPKYVDQIKLAEAAIQTRTYYFIPKEEIEKNEHNIQSGDLIAITTSMKNLDVVHVGFAIEREGRIHLLHASSKSMKVEISDKPLSEYLMGNKTQSGIMVSRLME